MLLKSLKGEELARVSIMSLSNQLGITSNPVVATMQDRASIYSLDGSFNIDYYFSILTNILGVKPSMFATYCS